MSNLETFMDMLCGTFDNREQCLAEDAAGARVHPDATHIIGDCTDRMVGLPEDFSGRFVIEESYFDMGERTIAKHYLFLYEETDGGGIRLTSYDPPADVPRESLTNSNNNLVLNYAEIRVSPRFTPLLLDEVDGAFIGENVSQFSTEALFRFRLVVKPDALYVTELLQRNGERVAGFDTPTVYVRSE